MFKLSNKTKAKLIKFDEKYHFKFEWCYLILGIIISIIYNIFYGFIGWVLLVSIHAAIFQRYYWICPKCEKSITEIKKEWINENNYISFQKCDCGIKKQEIHVHVRKLLGDNYDNSTHGHNL